MTTITKAKTKASAIIPTKVNPTVKENCTAISDDRASETLVNQQRAPPIIT